MTAVLAVAVSARPVDPAFAFGAHRGTIDGLLDPTAAAIDGDGTIYIAETTADHIRLVDRAGATVARWDGAAADAYDALAGPSGVAVLGAGDGARVFVVERLGHAVRVLDGNGRTVRRWGGAGRNPGAFKLPEGIAVDATRVYVADTGNDRVQVFGHDGAHELTIGSAGEADGQLRRPVAVAVDDGGHVYVVDADNSRIQKFDRDGSLVGVWGEWGPRAGLLNAPRGIAVDRGRVFVADTANHRIDVFDTDGVFLYQWGVHALLPREGAGKLHYPDAVAIDPAGRFAVVVESFENRCQIFDRAELPELQTASPPQLDPGQTHFGHRLSVDGPLLLVGEPETHQVLLFRIDREVPALISRFGGRGSGFDQFIRLTGVEIDRQSMTARITDAATRRLQRFRLEHDFEELLRYDPQLARFSTARSLDGIETDWPIEPAAIARHPDGRLHVVDRRNGAVHVFDESLEHQRSWGEADLVEPVDIAFAASGDAYVVDAAARCVRRFDDRGRPAGVIGGAGEPDTLVQPSGVAVDGDGFVYVSDAAVHRIRKYTAEGDAVSEWGVPGARDAELWRPAGIAVGDDGRIFVIDHGNHRGQIFEPDGTWLVTFSTGRPSTRSRPVNPSEESRKRGS